MVVTWHFMHAATGFPVPNGTAPELAFLDEGHAGVSLFMTLSGFLFAKLLDGKSIAPLPFLWNRLLRLAPLMMVVIGGRGTLLGPLLGAAVVGITLELLRSVNEARLSIFGLLLVLAVIFLPDGLVSLRWRRRPDPAEENATDALDSPLRP